MGVILSTLLAAFLIVTMISLMLFYTWIDPFGNRTKCAVIAFFCVTASVYLMCGGFYALPVGLLYAIGGYGFAISQEMFNDKVGMSAYMALLLPISPLIHSWFAIPGIRDNRTRRLLADIQRRQEIWRNEFRESGLSDPATFVAMNPEAIKPRVLIRNEEQDNRGRDWSQPSSNVLRARASVERRQARDKKRR